MNALVRLPLLRLGRTPRAWLPMAFWGFFAVGSAWALRHGVPAVGAGESLQSPFGALAVPLLAFATVSAALGGDGMARAARSLVAFGASPHRVALATTLTAAAVSGLLCALVGMLVAALGHTTMDPPLARDVLTTAWVSLLGGAAYACAFALGASFGKRGGGRVVVLVLDWVLGDGSTGVLTPRAHVRSLLGGPAIESLSDHVSAFALVALAVAFAWLTTLRARRF